MTSYPSVEPDIRPAQLTAAVEPANPPTQPMADGPRPSSKRPWLTALAADFVRFTMTMACCAAALLFVVQPRLREWQDDQIARAQMAEAERRVAEERAEALLEEIALGIEDIDVMTPPTNDKLFTILSKGVGIAEYAVRTDSVGLTAEAAFTTDLTTFQQTDAWTQEFTIKNLDATVPSLDLCWKPILWSTAGASCTAKCVTAAATTTCTGGVNDGANLAGGEAVSRRLDGTSCICVVGSAAGVVYQTERIVR